MLNVKSRLLTENAKIGLSVLLPEALILLRVGLRGPVNSDSTSLTINPVAFESTAIWPNQLAVTTLIELVVDDCVVSWRSSLLRRSEISIAVSTSRALTIPIHRHHTHLAHVFQRAELHSFEAQLGIFQAQLFTRRHSVIKSEAHLL